MTEIVLNKCYGGYSLSKLAYEFLGLEWDNYGYAFQHDRTNPKLIQCIEELGDLANGECSNLVIEEYHHHNNLLPEEHIINYDGFESIHD